MTATLLRSPQTASCSRAAARNVSPAASSTEGSCCCSHFASLPIDVVLPAPFTPASMITNGRAAVDHAAASRAVGSGRASAAASTARGSASAAGPAVARLEVVEQCAGRVDADVGRRAARPRAPRAPVVELAAGRRRSARRRACRATRRARLFSRSVHERFSAGVRRARRAGPSRPDGRRGRRRGVGLALEEIEHGERGPARTMDSDAAKLEFYAAFADACRTRAAIARQRGPHHRRALPRPRRPLSAAPRRCARRRTACARRCSTGSART